MAHTVQRYEVTEKARDDAECALRSLENSEQSNFDRLDQQEQALKSAKIIANDSDRKFEGKFKKKIHCPISWKMHIFVQWFPSNRHTHRKMV